MTVIPSDTLRGLPPKLRRLRRAIRLWHLANGLCWLCLTGAAVGLFDLGVDRFFRLDRPSRAIMLLLMLAAVAAVGWFKLVRPLLARLSDDALCLRVEQADADLNEAVISALQLSRLADVRALGFSPALVRRAVSLGQQVAEPIDFTSVVNTAARNRRLAGAVMTVAAVVAVTLAFGDFMGLYFSRNFALSGASWPQQTHLSIVGLTNGELVVPRGDDVRFQVQADGVDPKAILMDIQPAQGRRYTRQMKSIGHHRYQVLVRNVLEAMTIRARGGDGRTESVPVRLVDRPAVRQLTLTVRPPDYTGQAPHDLPPAQGVYDVLAGSTLVIRGEIEHTDLARPVASVSLLDRDQVIANTPLDASASTFELTIAAADLHGGSFGIELTDVNRLKSKRPARFSLRVVSDAPPMVHARLKGVGDLITPRATVPIECRFTDDFAVTAATLIYLDPTAPVSGDQLPPKRTQTLADLADQLGRRVIGPAVYRWQIKPLELPLGAHLTFHLAATDNDTFSGPKTGHGSQFSLKVVSDEELRGELLRREQEQRMEFERLLTDQKSWQVSVRALTAAIESAERMTQAQWEQLKALEKQQRLASGRCLAIAGRFSQALAEVENNKLEEAGGPMHQRMAQRIIEPLTHLADQAIPAAADPLELAARPSVDAAARRDALGQTVAQQRRIIDQMNDILANMVKVEGYQEAVNLLRQILKAQNDVNAETIKALEEQINKIFDK